MNLIDALVLIPLAWYTYKGFQNGLVKEVLSIVGIILAVFFTFEYMDKISVLIKPFFETDASYIPFLSGFILFAGTLLLVNIAAFIIKKTLEVAMLGIPNRIFGGVFGLLKSSIVISALFLLLAGFDLPSKESRDSSLTYSSIITVAPVTFNMIASVYPGAEDFTKTIEQTIEQYNPLNQFPTFDD